MIKTTMGRIGIVGAGMTGATVASLLRAEYPNSKLVVLDKGRGVGGRMSTSRSVKANSFSVDLGAQYISISEPYKERHRRFHEELIAAGVLAPLRSEIQGNRNQDPGVTHHVAPQGVSSIVKHFLNQSGAELHTSEQIIQVDVIDDRIEMMSESGKSYQCDSIVLTMPVPQILQLKGTIADIIESKPEVKQNLQCVSYSSRYAVGLFYNPNTKLSYTWGGKYIPEDPCIRFVAIEHIKRSLKSKPEVKQNLQCVSYSSRYAVGLFYNPNTKLSYTWGGKYIPEDPCIRFVAIEHIKRSLSKPHVMSMPFIPQLKEIGLIEDNPKLGPSVVVHTNAPFGLEHLEQDKNVMVPTILQHLRDVLPELPEPNEIKGHKWRFSQVYKAYDDGPGCVVLSERPLIVLAGDGFTRSTMDGCIQSALSTKDALLKVLATRSNI